MKTLSESRRRLLNQFLMYFFIGYIGIYILLTLNGSFYGPYSITKDKASTDGVFVLHHRYVWQPKWARFDRFDFNWLGAIYCPLVLVHQLVWHRDKIM